MRELFDIPIRILTLAYSIDSLSASVSIRIVLLVQVHNDMCVNVCVCVYAPEVEDN